MAADPSGAASIEFRRYLRVHPAQAALLPVIGAEVASAIDCTACAACCRQTRVEVSQAEVARIAAFLKLRPAEVRRMYTEPGADSLLAQPQGECVFLHQNQCIVYQARPDACRGFPFLAGRAACLGARLESIWRRASFCPIVFDTIEELKRRAGFHPHAGR